MKVKENELYGDSDMMLKVLMREIAKPAVNETASPSRGLSFANLVSRDIDVLF